jgi:ribose/xylose/arabinose/galactoside ABC-type transport system permease subunit
VISNIKGSEENIIQKNWLRKFVERDEFTIFTIFVIFVILWLIITPTLRDINVFLDLLREISPYFLTVIGVGILMIGGEFDLSVGSLLAVTNIVTVTAFKFSENIWIGILAGVFSGLIVGAINAFWVNRLGLNSLVATLAMMFTLRGLVYVYTGRASVVANTAWPGAMKALYYGSWAKIPIPLILSVVVLIIFYLTLTRTPFGRNIYALGSNSDAAIAVGINAKRTKLILFIISSFLTSISGLIVTSQTLSGFFNLGSNGWELTAITACVLGGLSLKGGRGSLTGAVIGMFIIGITHKGLRLMGVYTTWILVVNGIILIFALYAYRIRQSILDRRRV